MFEAMSGITSTGATVIVDLDYAPPGILLWRAILQWLGGIGIIVMGVAILPMLRVGGMQLVRAESSDLSEKILPRAAQVASAIGLIYLGFTLLCAALYWWAGMTPFDAAAHAMTTISTGGFSTIDASIGGFGSPTIDTIAIVFMILGALPFVLYIQAANGQLRPLYADTQVRWFFGILVVFVVTITLWLALVEDYAPRRGVSRHRVQRRLADHDHRLRVDRLRALGDLPGRRPLLPDGGRRLHRLDLRRHQDLPLRRAPRGRQQSVRAPDPTAWRVRVDLQPPPPAGGGRDIGDGVHFPVRPVLLDRRHRPLGARPRLS